jgi:hypothetical protein
MIQNIIGAAVGALVTYLLLVIMVGGPADKFVAPVVIGAIVSAAWPIAIGFWLARRAKARRDDKISAEVERQVAEQTKGN